ncbi:MAG: glutamine synthetase family protein [Bacteroidales bacterium]
MNKQIALSGNPIVEYLGEEATDFTREDIIKYIEENEIRHVNFMYPSSDGRLKTLNFFINNRAYLEEILIYGERVDGSSLFTFIDSSNSDIYVIPRIKTAFLDPFTEEPSVSFLCAFFDKDSNPLASSPQHTLHKAAEEFRKTTSMEFCTMGELEYYVIADNVPLYEAEKQHGYHESEPYAKFNKFRCECMTYIAQTGGLMKYGHSEVGNFILNDKLYEQNEIEFLPTLVEDAADQLMLAKWVIRNLGFMRGLNVTFAPKIISGNAGSGLHVHMKVTKGGKNMMLKNGKLSDIAKRVIAGLVDTADAFTAFSNMNPTSYFRLVPHQEAPTNICWGDRNRSALIRVPLGWNANKDMSAMVNPNEKPLRLTSSQKQTIEIRNGDGSADIYLMMAAVTVAARHGFEMDDALEVAAKNYVDVNIHKAENSSKLSTLASLPDSCYKSAQALRAKKDIYTAKGVFDSDMLESQARMLENFKDQSLREDVTKKGEKAILEVVNKYFHCG